MNIDKEINIDKCIENFIKDCADVCTAKQVNSFIDAVGDDIIAIVDKNKIIGAFYSDMRVRKVLRCRIAVWIYFQKYC